VFFDNTRIELGMISMEKINKEAFPTLNAEFLKKSSAKLNKRMEIIVMHFKME